MPAPHDLTALLERGRAARALLQDETFLSVLDDLSNYHIAALVAALPGEGGREAREHHHLLHYALSEIAGDLSGRVQTADEIEARMRENEDADL